MDGTQPDTLELNISYTDNTKISSSHQINELSTVLDWSGHIGLIQSQNVPIAMEHGYTTERVIIGTVLFLLILLTISGNVIVVLAVITQKKLRSVSNMFILSLSLTDLLVGTIVMIPAALVEIFREWILHPKFCSIWVSFDVMLCSASILNVCLISIDRYIAIMTPLRYRTIMNHRKTLLMLCGAWGIAILTSFVPIENGWHNPEVPSLENLTLFSKRPQCLFIISRPYAVTATGVTVLLPIMVALTLYYRVSKEAKRQTFLVGTLITAGNVLLGHNVASKHIREPFTRKATVTLGIIVGAYVVTWSPFLCANIAQGFCRCIPEKAFVGIVWLGWCNSLINPIIYPLFMRDFRKIYIGVLKRCCPIIAKMSKHKVENKFYSGVQISR